jgi:hypothetical protein
LLDFYEDSDQEKAMNRSTCALAAVVFVVASGSLLAQSRTRAVPREFIHVRTLGRALSEFNDDRIQVAAAYYYSQDHHDSRWLLIELGALGQQTTKINRDQIELVTPTGRIVPLATQTRWGQDSERNALLLQQARTSRHPVGSYFKGTNGQRGLRFFTRPPNFGTVVDFVDLAPNELVLGDLLFESPTRLWDKGTYALVVRYDGAEAVLPIELR